MSRKRSARAIEKEQDELDARLRSYGEDEARRRWRASIESGAWYGPNRHHVLADFEKMAAEQKPERMQWIREHMGEREAEFRQGLAQEIAYSLRKGLPQIHELSLAERRRFRLPLSPEEKKERKESRLHQAWLDRPMTPEYNEMKFEEFRRKQTKHGRTR